MLRELRDPTPVEIFMRQHEDLDAMEFVLNGRGTWVYGTPIEGSISRFPKAQADTENVCHSLTPFQAQPMSK